MSAVESSIRVVDENETDFFDNKSEDKDSGINLRSDSQTSSSEFNDAVANLPENWENLDFQRKKSCILSNIYSTCVNKAINHLEILQNAIDKWMTKNSRSAYSNTRYAQNLGVKTAFEMIRSRAITTAPMKNSEIALSRELSNKTDFSKSTNLELVGVGVSIPTFETEKSHLLSKRTVETADTSNSDIKGLDVINEVLILFARLDNDRKRTELQFEEEKRNVAWLRKKLDRWGLKRLFDLPILVQKEHEACITDITELEWHISFHSQNLKKLQHKLNIEEKFYNQLKSEIDDMHEKTPLIEEKCSLELKAIQNILRTQEQTNELLGQARDKHAEVLERNKEAHTKADREMEALNLELEFCRRELNKAKKRLEEAEEIWRNYLKTLDESNVKIAKNKVDERDNIIKRDHNREKKAELSKNNSQIQNDRFKVKKEADMLTLDNGALQERIDDNLKLYHEEIQQLTRMLNEKKIKMERVHKKIMEKEVNIEDMQIDLNNIKTNIEKEEFSKEKLMHEKQRNESQLNILKENLARGERIHDSVSTNLEKDAERYQNFQENIKQQIVETKRQIKEERFYYTSLSARLNTEIDEFKLSVVDAKQRKQQFEVKKKELDSRLSKLEVTVAEMEEAKAVLEAKVNRLQASVHKLKDEYANTEKDLTEKIFRIKPLKIEQNAQLEKRKKELQDMKKHTKQMNEKNAEMDEAMVVMLKSIDRTNTEINKIQKIADEINTQNDAAKSLDNQAKYTLEEVAQRNQNGDMSHLELMKERQAYYNDLQENLANNLQRNKSLASRYREVKYEMYLAKINLFLKVEKGLGVYTQLSDKRQVHTLQARMHRLLQDYFNYKILHGQQMYVKLTNESVDSYEKLTDLEKLFQSSVSHITHFINNQEDFDVVHQRIMQKVHKEELIEVQARKVELEKLDKLKLEERLANDKHYKARVKFNLENLVA